MLEAFSPLNEIKLEQNTSLKDLAMSEGLQFGLGVFETMRRLPEGIEDFQAHMTRLKNSAVQLKIPIPVDFDNTDNFKRYLESFKKQDRGIQPLDSEIGVIKLTLLRQGSSSLWIVSERPFLYTKKQLEEGLSLTVSEVQRSSTSFIQRHKTLNYAENWLEKQKAIENGYQEVLFLNENHELTEASASNLFFYKEGCWRTPEIDCGLLPGIMRQRVIDHFNQVGKPVIEGRFVLKDILSSEKVILTNALMGVMPVKSIGTHQFDVKSCTEILNYHVIDPARLLFV